jgi:hypothetical protein
MPSQINGQINGQRETVRYDTDVTATLSTPNMTIAVRMLSVSAGGALVRMDRLSAKVFEADSFLLEIRGVGRFSATKKWRRDTDIGAKFDLSDADRLRLADRLANQFGARRPSYSRIAANSAQP